MHRGHTWHDYSWPRVSLTWLLYNLQLWRYGRRFRKFTVRFRPIGEEIASSMYNNKKLLDEAFVICRGSRSPRVDITKTKSNNCFIIYIEHQSRFCFFTVIVDILPLASWSFNTMVLKSTASKSWQWYHMAEGRQSKKRQDYMSNLRPVLFLMMATFLK